MNACPECAGNLKFDPALRRYVCQSCGLSLNREEIDEMAAKNTSADSNEEKEKRKKEYLKWWSTKK